MNRAKRPALRVRCVHSTTVSRAGRARSLAPCSSSRTSPSRVTSRFCPWEVCVCSRLRSEETARRQPTADGRPLLRASWHVPRRPHGRGAAPARRRNRDARHLLAEGLRPADDALPRCLSRLPLLCGDVCGYCTSARPPRRGERAYLTEDEVLAIARAGREAGCTEALFTLGDRPEARYRVAREELAELGCRTTLEYLGRCARRVLEETGLLPHLNPGVMTRDELAALRPVAASMGIMLETTAERLRPARRPGPAP